MKKYHGLYRSIITHDFIMEQHYRLNKSTVTIGKEVGCSATLVCYYMNKLGIKCRKKELIVGRLNNSNTKFKPGSVPWNKGKILPRGKDHNRWQGGKFANLRHTDPLYRDWRKIIFSRDNYTCQQCGSIGGKLNAHHILPWSSHEDLRYEISNGVTLCKSCHMKTDAYGGRARSYKKLLKSVTLS